MSHNFYEQQDYNLSAAGQRWRSTDVPGVGAIPFEDLVFQPLKVRHHMAGGNWPILAEIGSTTVAVTMPYQKAVAASLISSSDVVAVNDEYLRKVTPAVLLAALGNHAVSIAFGQEKPQILVNILADQQRRDVEADFSELIVMDEERIAAGDYLADPEHPKVSFLNSVLTDPLGTNFAHDMAQARARRLNRPAQ